jgi:hypothetical protein
MRFSPKNPDPALRGRQLYLFSSSNNGLFYHLHVHALFCFDHVVCHVGFGVGHHVLRLFRIVDVGFYYHVP